MKGGYAQSGKYRILGIEAFVIKNAILYIDDRIGTGNDKYMLISNTVLFKIKFLHINHSVRTNNQIKNGYKNPAK